MIPPSKWQPTIPFDAVILDCDGTMSAIEGIDELARMNGVGQEVEALTADAMGRTGMTIQLYQHRLSLVRPSLTQLTELAEHYYLERSPQIETAIQLLLHLGKTIFVISAGLYPSVFLFSEKLGIDKKNVFAVEIDFDPEGQYVDFDHASPLVTSHGKQSIVLEIRERFPNTIYVGDGLNDLAVRDFVTRFLGYGGHFYRRNIQEQCEFYLTQPSFLALLPLALTQVEVEKLSSKDTEYYQAGLALLGETEIRSSKTKQSP